MSASRHRPRSGGRRSLGLVIFFVAMMPTPVGFQDLAALIARQPAVSDRWRHYARVTPFGSVQAATLSFPQPLGTMIPIAPGYTFASLDPRALDITGSIGNPRLNPLAEPAPTIEFPTVNRTLKGDLLVPRERLVPAEPKRLDKPKKAPEKTQDRAQFEPPKPPVEVKPAPEPAKPQVVEAKPEAPKPEAPMADAPKPEIAAVPQVAPVTPELSQPKPQVEAERAEPELPSGMDLEFSLPQPQPPKAVAEVAPATEPDSPTPPQTPDSDREPRPEPKQAEAEILTDEEPQDSDVAIRSEMKTDNPAERIARLFFGADTLGPTEGKLQPWREGEAPVLMPMHPSVDPDIKRAAIVPAQKEAALTPDVKPEGETIAPKGEVTGEGKRPMTPAERLGLTGASRAKHERCLTNAIYFEARGENERGQMAVAQVVLNRAFSGYYPDNVCGVVYQNSHRHLACQFTFACDNVRDVVTEPDAWETAKRIARDSLDGKIWLPEIGKATHYHATYVSPWWVRTMTKHKTLGIHIFYRPTRWGDGAEAPAWGPAASVEKSAAAARM
ncbi:MAG TPA: cell wall hydrolase [Pseudorhodoplanes sp.]|nr:cell wall hydrolase [Pseudorhodoplanes sp.]